MKTPKAKPSRVKTKWIFGYKGATETYWLMACSYRNLLKQISDKGMAAPDWHEDTGNRA